MSSLLEKEKGYYSSDRVDMLDFIPENSRKTLEVGCGEGNFSLEIKKKLNAETWGVEFNKESAENAKNKLYKVFNGDINTLLPDLPDNYFDCIIFNDVIEHITDPFILLKNLKCKFSSKGVLIASIPNVRYINVLNSLIFKKDWEYIDAGILDYTHLRFFTQKSIKRMFELTGYDTIEVKGINSTNQFRYYLWNIIFPGQFIDSKYKQFACVARLKQG